jgi:hypothetical protein
VRCRCAKTGSGLPSDTKRVPEYLTRRLAEAYERFLKMAPSNSYAVVDKDGWRLSTDPTEPDAIFLSFAPSSGAARQK